MAERGQLVIDRGRRRVGLILEDGARYTSGRAGETSMYTFPEQVQLSLDPDSVFGRQELPRTVTEKSIAELRADGARRLKEGFSPHPEIIYTQQKFSIPVACLVFAVIGLALGLTSSRDTKMAGFVVGLAVVFAYYAILEIGAAQTRGHYRTIEEAKALATASWTNAYLARWWPNIIMGVFGIGGSDLARAVRAARLPRFDSAADAAPAVRMAAAPVRRSRGPRRPRPNPDAT